MLYWEGDPIECVYVIRSGAIKIFSTSQDGKTYTYGVMGRGEMRG
jgi:CRP-like cAMP-binding protein